jgi:hypothetical protein
MSNCVEIRNEHVIIPASKVDVERLKAYLAGIPMDRPKDPELDPEMKIAGPELQSQRRDLICAWWFLVGNDGKPLVDFVGDEVILRLGWGRSTHTWRDFRWVCEFLGKFCTATHDAQFAVRDEGGWAGKIEHCFGEEVKF